MPTFDDCPSLPTSYCFSSITTRSKHCNNSVAKRRPRACRAWLLMISPPQRTFLKGALIPAVPLVRGIRGNPAQKLAKINLLEQLA